MADDVEHQERSKSPSECYTKEDTVMYKMKVAVALACLRTKPDSINGQEYARQLCDKFRTSQLHWKQKLEETEVEMLHLKQELALYKHRQHHNEEQTDLPGSQVLFPTPPPSTSPDKNEVALTEPSDSSTSLSKHMTFLQHVITMHNSASLINDKNLENLVHSSLLHSLDLLKENHKGNEFISKLRTQCVSSLNKVVQKVSPQLKSEIIDKTSDIMEEIVDRVASRLILDQKAMQEETEVIVQLGNNPMFLQNILKHLTTALIRFSNHLRDTLSNKTVLDPVYYSNMYFIFDSMEKCLSNKQAAELEKEFKSSIIQELEDSALFLSETFPLYTMAVWRLCCKLSS